VTPSRSSHRVTLLRCMFRPELLRAPSGCFSLKIAATLREQGHRRAELLLRRAGDQRDQIARPAKTGASESVAQGEGNGVRLKVVFAEDRVDLVLRNEIGQACPSHMAHRAGPAATAATLGEPSAPT
jgi:hypothetical protein